MSKIDEEIHAFRQKHDVEVRCLWLEMTLCLIFLWVGLPLIAYTVDSIWPPHPSPPANCQ
jgi:hypothetical protein